VDIKKLALIATFAFVISGIVIYQVRSTRGNSRVLTTTEGRPAAPAASAPETPQVPLPRIATAEVQGEAPRPAAESQGLAIPPKGWGRSPFLTVEEIAELNKPEPAAPAPVDAPVATPVVEALPQYVYKGRFSSRDNVFAFIDDRQFQVGDRIGKETITEIKEDSVILESDGRSRQLSKNPKPGA